MYIQATPSDNLQQIIDSAPHSASVFLTEGTFCCKLVVKKNINIVGAGAGKTIICYDDYANKIHADGQQYNTFRTYTVAVLGDDVSMSNLTIANCAPEGVDRGQRVTLSVYGDNFTMNNCTLRSTQDTLFVGPLPDDLMTRYIDFLPAELNVRYGILKQYFINTTIIGTVDFVFGCGQAIFDNCNLVSDYDGRDVGYVCAPSHSAKQTTGFVFCDCKFTSAKNVADNSVYLARPWRDFGKCEFVNCSYAPHINGHLFDKWNDSNRDRFARFAVDKISHWPDCVDWATAVSSLRLEEIAQLVETYRQLLHKPTLL